MESALLNSSWLKYDEESHFPLENVPFGCFKTASGNNHCCTRIGDHIVDLALLFPKFKGPLFSNLTENVFDQENLNKFAALGKEFRIEARETIQKIFSDPSCEAEIRPQLLNANEV